MKTQARALNYPLIVSLMPLLLLVVNVGAQADLPDQPQYWLYLADKGPEAMGYLRQPERMLSAEALARRRRMALPVTMSDVPVSRTYRRRLQHEAGLELGYASRWLNAIAVRYEGAIGRIVQRYDFVRRAEPMQAVQVRPAGEAQPDTISYGPAREQAQLMNMGYLHNQGYQGGGVNMAIFDSGFNNMPNNPAFDSLFQQNRVRATRDFYKHDTIDYTEDSHGAQTSSTILAIDSSSGFRGTATGVNVMLARTENVAFERHIEESNWLAAMEWADSAGAQIISSSLTYNYGFTDGESSYQLADMDGQTTIIARAAVMAAQKGMLVVSSAGNEGQTNWGRIGSPCDADSILCVGAVDRQGQYASFSSRGPSADGRLKPEVSAVGANAAYIRVSGSVGSGNGTSFSAPIVAGLAACLMQKHPGATNMQLRRAIMLSGSQAQHPDSLLGYGVPNACKADSILNRLVDTAPEQPPKEPTLVLGPNPSSGRVKLLVRSACSMRYDLQILDPAGRPVYRINDLRSNVRFPLNLSRLNNGVYLLRVRTPQGVLHRRLMMQGQS